MSDSMTWEPGLLLPCKCGRRPRVLLHGVNGKDGHGVSFSCCGVTSGEFWPDNGGAPLAVQAWNAEQKEIAK